MKSAKSILFFALVPLTAFCLVVTAHAASLSPGLDVIAKQSSMVKAGIIQGADGNVNPQGSATRAEVAVMCARLVELMK